MKIRGPDGGPGRRICRSCILKDVASDIVLPIWVGMYEANAIALEVEKTTTPRPMTHDLLKNLIHGLNAEVQRVVVTELRDDTFYAVIWMEQNGEICHSGCPAVGRAGAGAAVGLPDLRARGSAAGGQGGAECGGFSAQRTSCALAGKPQ